MSFPIAVIDGVEPPSSAGHANLIFAVNFHPTKNIWFYAILPLNYTTIVKKRWDAPIILSTEFLEVAFIVIQRLKFTGNKNLAFSN